jgi:hypothetical protein
VGYRERQRAKLNRGRREREQDVSRTRREWLNEQKNNPPFAELLAALGSSIEKLALRAEKTEVRKWGAKRGPPFDPARGLRDASVANAVRYARDAGQSYEDAIDAGVTVLRQWGSGASSRKTVEAIVAGQRKMAARDPADIEADLEQANAKLREYGLDV